MLLEKKASGGTGNLLLDSHNHEEWRSPVGWVGMATIPRIQLFEIEDQGWCPRFLRDLATENLRFLQERFRLFAPVVPLLKEALEKTLTTQVIDLCSGGGGPVLWTAPLIKPVRWTRFFWTYLIPLVPFILWWDGLVSQLRAYTADELIQIANSVAPGTCDWRAGRARRPFPITFLVGFPDKKTQIDAAANMNVDPTSLNALRFPKKSL
jgi:hypothetical protein